MKFLFGLISGLVFSVSGFAKSYVNEAALVYDPNKTFISLINSKTSYSVDHLNDDGYEVYGPKGLYEFLKSNGVRYDNLNVLEYLSTRLNDYPSFEQNENRLKSLHEKYPEITDLFSIGDSVKGRALWVMKISDNAADDETEPEVKYISSMHGNEIAGRELMMELIEDLLEDYGSDKRITDLIDNTEIFIMPSMNPDGSYFRMRGNANYADLNRDFPDFSTSDNEDVYQNREPETQAVMKFQRERKFALSANFHGGAECVNYPWDTIKDKHPRHDLVYNLSLDYAKAAPYIYSSTSFEDGVTNGYEWYEVNGGMQDWSDYWYGDLQVTVELSNSKWPSYGQIPYYYEENKEALIQYLEDVHQGAGFRFDSPDISGTVSIFKKVSDQLEDLGSKPFSDSEFYRVLEAGEYVFQLEVSDAKRHLTDIVVEEDSIRPNGNYSEISL